MKNNRKMRRFSSLALAAAMAAFSGMSLLVPTAVSAEGETTHTVTISNGGKDEAAHTYTAYQIFKGELEDGVLKNITWGSGIGEANADSVYSALSDAFGKDFASIDDVLSFLTQQENDSEVMMKFAKVIAGCVTGSGVGTVTVTGNNSGTISGLTDGYYLFAEDDSDALNKTDAAYSRFILKVEGGNLNVTAKKDVPSITKKIDQGSGVEANVASIGDTVPYILNTKVPDMKGYERYYFVVNDTMASGLDFDASSVTATIGDPDNGGITLTPGNGLEVQTGEDADGYTFQIVFDNFIQYKYNEFVEDAAGTYYKLADGSYTTTAPADAAEKLYDDVTVKYIKGDDDKYIVDEDGTYYRLADGTYTNVSPENPAGLYDSTTTKYSTDFSRNDIVIKYDAVLNEKADRTTAGNENTVNLTFSNNPNHEYNGDNEPSDNEKTDGNVVGQTPDSNTKTYTTGIKVVKIDAKTGERLKNAEFTLEGAGVNKVVYRSKNTFTAAEDGTYYKLKNGTYTDEAPTAETKKYYESTTTKYTLEFEESAKDKTTSGGKNTVSFLTDDAGLATFSGLGAGTYTLSETAAPSGYNPLGEDITFTLEAEPTLNGPGWKLNGEDVSPDGELFIKEFVVENNKGVTLPGTGGMGTTVFYIVGGSLIAGAGVLFITKKRMNIKEK